MGNKIEWIKEKELDEETKEKIPSTIEYSSIDDRGSDNKNETKFKIDFVAKNYEFSYFSRYTDDDWDLQSIFFTHTILKTITPGRVEISGTGKKGEVIIRCKIDEFEVFKRNTELPKFPPGSTEYEKKSTKVLKNKVHVFMFRTYVGEEGEEVNEICFLPDISSKEFSKGNSDLICLQYNMEPKVFRFKEKNKWERVIKVEWDFIKNRYFRD